MDLAKCSMDSLLRTYARFDKLYKVHYETYSQAWAEYLDGIIDEEAYFPIRKKHELLIDKLDQLHIEIDRREYEEA